MKIEVRIDPQCGEVSLTVTAPAMTDQVRRLVGRLAHLAGLIPEAAPVSPEELVPLFAWEKLPRRDIAMEPW